MQEDDFQIHTEDYLFFRHHTDEIKVFVQEISKELERNMIKTFLDIGAGSGELTRALISKLRVKKGVAIDVNNYIQQNGQKIIFTQEDWLNFSSPEKFDLILACHSIAYLSSRKIRKAIAKMYKFLNAKGKAVIIIYNNGDKDAWLMFKKLFYPPKESYTIDYIRPIIINYQFKEKCFVTKVYADDVESMFRIGRFLAEKHLFSYLDRREEIKKFFEKYQRRDKKIIFPLRHKMFILSK